MKRAISDARKKAIVLEKKFELDDEQCVLKWKEQNGKCHYSSMPLSNKLKDPWTPCLTLIDRSKHYEYDNVAFVSKSFVT
jgi:hypothetical protein